MSVLNTITLFAAESAAQAEEAGHAAEEATGITALGLDPLALLAQTGTFLLLFWIVKRYALDKIVETLEHRRKTIDNSVRLGQKMEAEHAKLEEKIEAELRKARTKADEILADAQRESGETIRAAQDQASQEVDKMIADAHVKISQDMANARKDLERDMLKFVAEATEAVIEEKLDAKKDESLIQKALSNVGVRR